MWPSPSVSLPRSQTQPYIPPSGPQQVTRMVVKRKVQYLVKWSQLPYSEASWENAEDIDDDQKVAEYRKIADLAVPAIPSPRPPPSAYAPMKEAPVFLGGNLLRSYQVEGLEWLAYNWFQGRGSILADEMGLGKTIQSVCFLEYMTRNVGVAGPFLIVVPLSTITQWKREFAEWTNLNVVIFWGTEPDREVIRSYEWKSRSSRPGYECYRFNVMVTTYEMILRGDALDLGRVYWRVLIVDEAHRLKSQTSKLLERLSSFHTEHRILLTGTPMQNRVSELWTLLNFAAPTHFPDETMFLRHYGDISNFTEVQALQRVLRPYLLRRLKEDVEKAIPPKEEVLVELTMSEIQKQYYRAILERNRTFLNRGATGTNAANLRNVFMQLRKVCNHPFLIEGAEDREANVNGTAKYLESLVMASSKMQLLDKLLPKLFEQKHRVLIFSQMVRLLDILETYIRLKGWNYERLDGGVRGNDRQASIDRFTAKDSDRFIFLLCTRAGGVGINLTSADTVIIYDSDWNPQNDIQAQARCHRIGQESDVKVYRLLTKDSYEIQMFQMASKKLGLDHAVLSNMDKASEFETKKVPSNKALAKEINSLLKHGVYCLFHDEKEGDKEETNLMTDNDVDKILERTSRIVQYGTEGGEKGGLMGNSTFSKAVFEPTDSSGVDVNDPDFWGKVLPAECSAATLLRDLKDEEKLTTKEEAAKFFHDLQIVSSQVIAEWKQNRFGENQGDIIDLEMILQLVSSEPTRFTKQQMKQVQGWKAALASSRKRSRTKTETLGTPTNKRRRKNQPNYEEENDDDEEYEDSDDEEDTKSKKGRKKQELKKKHKGLWSPDEQKRFVHAVVSFPRGRWSDIRAFAKLESYEEEQLQKYGGEWALQCASLSQGDTKEFFLEVAKDWNESFANGNSSPSLSSPSSPGSSSGRVRRTPRRASRVASLSLSSHLSSIDPSLKGADFAELVEKKARGWVQKMRLMQRLDVVIQKEPSIEDFRLTEKRKALADWWSHEEDMSLLYGVHEHGLSDFPRLFLDHRLSFSKNEEGVAAHKKGKPGGRLSGSKGAGGITARQLTAYVRALVDSVEKVLKLKEREKEKLKRQEKREMEIEERERKRKELKNQKKEELTKKKEQQRTERRQKLMAQRQKQKLDKLKKELAEKKRLLEMKRKIWTKQERKLVYICLMTFGLHPLVDEFRSRANLRQKSNQSIAIYLRELVEFCVECAKADSKSDSAKKSKKGKKKKKGGDELENMEDDFDEMDGPESNFADVDSGLPTKSKELYKKFNLGERSALQLFYRLELFANLRSIIQKEDWQSGGDGKGQAERALLLEGFPSWWIPIEHEKLLIEGIIEFGLEIKNSEEWESYLSLTNGCWAYEGTTEEEAGERREFLLNFLQEKGALVKYLKAVQKCVLGGKEHRRAEGLFEERLAEVLQSWQVCEEQVDSVDEEEELEKSVTKRKREEEEEEEGEEEYLLDDDELKSSGTKEEEDGDSEEGDGSEEGDVDDLDEGGEEDDENDFQGGDDSDTPDFDDEDFDEVDDDEDYDRSDESDGVEADEMDDESDGDFGRKKRRGGRPKLLLGNEVNRRKGGRGRGRGRGRARVVAEAEEEEEILGEEKSRKRKRKVVDSDSDDAFEPSSPLETLSSPPPSLQSSSSLSSPSSLSQESDQMEVDSEKKILLKLNFGNQ